MTAAKRKVADGKGRRTEQEQRLDALVEELLRIRASDSTASDEEIRRHRHEGRP